MLTASMGFSPSELYSSARYCDVTTTMSPHAVSLVSDTSAETTVYGDASRGFWVFTLAEALVTSQLTPGGSPF
jgi:hypothetical protein